MTPVDPPVVEVVARDVAPEAAEERSAKLRVSVVPGLGLAANPDVAVEGVAVGAVSHQPSLRGADGELAASWVDGRMAGAQGALGAAVAGEVSGLQGAGVAWTRGALGGAQLAFAFAGAGDDVRGLQGALGASVALADLRGLQVGSAAYTRGSLTGLQAGYATWAGEVEGVQAGFLNVAGEARGLQLGLVNVAERSRGVQLGLVNVARTSKVSIAPLNFVADGIHRVDVLASESSVLTLAGKFGSRHVYTLVGAGLVNRQQAWWTFGGGFGVHLPADPLWLEVDATGWGLANGARLAPGGHAKLRATAGLQLLKHVAPFAGVSANGWIGDGSVAPRAVRGLPEDASRGRELVTWPGVHAGVSFGQ